MYAAAGRVLPEAWTGHAGLQSAHCNQQRRCRPANVPVQDFHPDDRRDVHAEPTVPDGGRSSPIRR